MNLGGTLDVFVYGNLTKAIETFVGNQLSDATRVAYRYDLKKWFDWYGYYDELPSVPQVVQFRQYLESQFKTRTALRIFTTVRGFYKFMGGFNPFQNIKAPKPTVMQTPEVPDDAVIDRMLSLVDNNRDRVMLLFMLQGVRRAEITTLRVDDLIWMPEYGIHAIKVVGKGNKERFVPLNTRLSLALRDYGVLEGYLFPGDADGHINVNVVEWVSEKWSKAAGKRLSPHKYRHHFATRLVRAGATVLQVSNLLGHASVATTQIYVHLVLSDLADAVMLDPMNVRTV